MRDFPLGVDVEADFFSLTGVSRRVSGELNSVKNDGSASVGADTKDIVADLLGLGLVGERLFVSADDLLPVNDPRDEDCNNVLLRCLTGGFKF